ncbi:hypothetical protein [Nocardioides sp.]|uniref:hypothetical protein n=1 Tax=Nocardioides sp. TaxID=35761 RepID=UPI002613E59E|nr:hypothetical protein [Nocardioides sp.]MDI6912206.1 hypothetical protein [Nocardioides sp.]
MQIRTVTCAECGRAFETRSPRARFCPDNDRCRKAASRRPTKLGRHEMNAQQSAALQPAAGLTAVPTQAEALQELDAASELLERDLDVLEVRFPREARDEVFDELIGGLATYLSSIAGLRALVEARCGDA